MSKVEIIKRPVEEMSGSLKKSAWAAIVESLALMVLGVLFIAWPDVMMTAITYVVGGLFIVEGIWKIINYFVVKGQNDFFNNGLLSGVVAALIGIAVLAIGEDIANVFRVVVGIFMVYEALVRINTSIKLHAVGVGIWKYITILALVMLVLGVIVIFTPTTDVIGWMMIIVGLIGVIGDIMFIQQVNSVVEKLKK